MRSRSQLVRCAMLDRIRYDGEGLPFFNIYHFTVPQANPKRHLYKPIISIIQSSMMNAAHMSTCRTVIPPGGWKFNESN